MAKMYNRKNQMNIQESKRDDATIAIEVSDDGVDLPNDIEPAPKSKYKLSHDPYARKADWSLNFVRQLRPWTELPLGTSLHLACPQSGLMKSRVKTRKCEELLFAGTLCKFYARR